MPSDTPKRPDEEAARAWARANGDTYEQTDVEPFLAGAAHGRAQGETELEQQVTDIAALARALVNEARRHGVDSPKFSRLESRIDLVAGPRFHMLATRPSECHRFIRERLDEVRVKAREMGYAVAVHGSLARDVDLIAVPWVEDAAPADRLVDALMETIGRCDFTNDAQSEAKPHGRLGWSFWMHEYSTYVDLSIITKETTDDRVR